LKTQQLHFSRFAQRSFASFFRGVIAKECGRAERINRSQRSPNGCASRITHSSRWSRDEWGTRFLVAALLLLTTLLPAQSARKRFLTPRIIGQQNLAERLAAARATQAAMLASTPLSTPWQPAGPNQVETTLYGDVTGRVTSIAIDPADPSGNTVYLGTTGGGVWKSTNAASSNPSFVPLTDTLPVFSANSGTSVIPSLSIGAVSVQPGGTGVLLAGTGDPNDASDSFYGEGILRSADNGLTWTIAQKSNDGTAGRHLFLGEGVAGFAWSALSPQLVVAAVSQAAEGTLVGASESGASTRGLFYSIDAGVTWQMSTIMDGTSVVQAPTTDFSSYEGNAATAVVYNPIRHKFYAALRFHGYYESADGQTWTRLAVQPGTGLTLANCPTRAGAPGVQSCPIFRGALAVQPVTGDLFALTADGGNIDQGLWQDACTFNGSACLSNTVLWANRLNTTPLENNSAIPQADYNLALAAVPTTTLGTPDTILFAGTEEIFRCSLASGCSLRNTTNATTGCVAPAKVAPAQHAIAAGNGGLIFFGNDGGLWRSTDLVAQSGTPCSADDATHFQNLNNGLGSLAEITSLATHPTDADTMLVGLGVLGSAFTSAASSIAAWQQLGLGESGSVAIDQVDPRNWFVQSGGGVSIFRCSKGTACTASDFNGPPLIGAAQTSKDISLVDAPFLLDPALNTNLITGSCRVWRGPAADGSLWSTSNLLSVPLSGSATSACTAADALIRSLAVGGPAAASTSPQNAGSTVLYAGMAGTLDGGGFAGGHLYATLTGQTNSSSSVWADRTANTVSNDVLNAGLFNPGGFDLSSIFVDPHDGSGNTVYVTVMGFGFPHVYRSTDAGATWLNLSGNLPNAPANAVVVDPNDAGIVYVATDTGVYVTTAVDTCATANCWSVYGTGLPNAPVTALKVQTGVSVPGGAQAGALGAGTYGRGIWQIPLVTAGAVPAPALQVRPETLTFGSQPVGTTSSSQTITISNAGSASLNLLALAITGDFAVSGSCTATSTLAPAASCIVAVSFAPKGTGTRSGTLTVTSDAGTKTVALSGNAPGPTALILTPAALVFASTPVGTSTAPKNITVSDVGTANATLGTASVTGDFVLSADTCSSTLSPQAGCTLSITFKPTASGTRTGTLTLSSDSGVQTASLTGVGTSPATDILSPSVLNFPDTVVTTTSSAQTVTLTNSGDVALTLIAASITSGDFTVTNACGNSLSAHSSCAMQIFFVPRSVGPQTGLLTVTDAFGTQTVTLAGTGKAPPGVSLLPLSLSFGATGVGNASTPQTITLTNNGDSPLVVSSFALSEDFGIVIGTNACSTGAPIPVGQACTMQVAFTPRLSGARLGTLTVVSNAPNSPLTSHLSGTGVDFTWVASASTAATLSNGQSAAFPFLLTPSTLMAQPVVFSCTGAPANAKCTVTPASADLSAITTVTATILTGTTTGSVPANHRRTSLWLAVLLLPAALLRRRRRVAAALFALIVIAGCGLGRKIPGDGSNSGSGTGAPTTPGGTYPVTVSATSAGLTKSVTLTITVQ